MDMKISVIVPVYNAEQYIERCIISILNQSYKNIELLLIDDGSTDKSLYICRKFEKIDKRVKVFTKKNGGAASARNFGLRHLTGDYVGFCDADDYLEKDMYEVLLSKMIEFNLKTICCLANVRDENGKLLSEDSKAKTVDIISSREAIRQIFLRKGNVHLATRLIEKAAVNDLYIPEGKRVEDFFFTICILAEMESEAVYNYPFYNYLKTSNSVTRSASGSIYLDAIYFYHKAIELLKDKGISFPEEQEYYLLKMYYLLFISAIHNDWVTYKTDIISCKHDLKKRRKSIYENPYLKRKEKIVLCIGMISVKLCRLFYLCKNCRRQ